MDPFLIPQVIDLAGENPAKTYRQPLASGDSAAHRWVVRVVRAGAAADLTGCSAAVLARREGEDSSPTVRQPAKIAGNVASADFIPEVYALGGRILAMMVISGSDERVITAAVLRMQGKTYTTDTICDPEGTIPSLEALLARYEDMVTATGESRAATQAAQQATEETRSALTDAQAALATAQQAVTDAQGALGTAQTAADTANAAAVKIDEMTVSATPLDAGTATAALTLVDGHYHLTLGLPKGDTGATPRIRMQVTTGAAGSDASVSVSGTAEEPVIHLTIPRGDTGAIKNMTINGKPVESGTITLTPEDLGAASAQEVSALKDDIGEKLGKTETAANSAKLGGKAPEYYLQPRNLLDNSDFTNPVNQRGITTFSETSGYWLDRWVETRCSIDLTANTASVAEGTANNGYFYQRMPRMDDGKELTFAIKIGDDLFVASGNIQEGSASTSPLLLETAWGGLKIYSVNDLSIAMVYISAGNTISLPVWAALYEGTYTAETLPPYVPKGYAAELAECQRYFVVLSGNLIGIAHPYTTNDVYMTLYMPTKMRRKPTVELTYLRISNSSYITDSDASISSVDNMSTHNTAITFFANTSSTLTLGRLYGVSTTGGVYISADL